MKLKNFIKIGVSAVMIVLVLRLVDFEHLRQVFASVPVVTVVTAILVYTAGQFVSALRWHKIARAGGVPVSYASTLKASYIGMFINFFGFGLVGGDVARGLLLSLNQPYKAEAVASVVADRVHGLTVLALIGMLAVAIGGAAGLPSVPVLLLSAIAVGGIIFWFYGTRLLLLLVPSRYSWRQKLEHVFRVFPRQPRTLAVITALSVIFHFIQIGLGIYLVRALNVPVPVGMLLVVIPIVNILCSIPISWNGLGVREKTYLFFLGSYLANEQALALGALWMLAVLCNSAIGGIVAFLTEDLTVLKQKRAEEKETRAAMRAVAEASR